MEFIFDDDVSDRFEAKLREVSAALDAQTPVLESAANNMRMDAAGNFLKSFETRHMTEHDDRFSLKRSLEDLADGVANAKKLAQLERERRAAVDAYTNREEVTPNDGKTPQAAEAGHAPNPDPGPKPDMQEPVPPHIESSVTIREIPRGVEVSGQSKSSARPEHLRGYVRIQRTLSGQLARTRGGDGVLEFELRTLWGEYLDNCSWVFLDAESVRTALWKLIEVRAQSADWLENVADAFEKAGGPGGPNGALLLSDGLANEASTKMINAETANRILTDPNSSKEQMAEAIRIVEGHTDLLSDEARRRAADVVGADVRDQNISDATVDLMGLLAADPVYSHQLFTTVTPDQFADALKGLYDDSYSVYGSGSYGGTRIECDPDRVRRYLDFLTAAGTALATYTKGTGELAPPADLSGIWFNAMIDPNNPENASALSMMIDKGGEVASYDPEFLSSLTDQIYDHELAHPNWWERPGWDSTGVSGFYEDIGDPNNPNDSTFSMTPHDNPTGRAAGLDPLANLLGAMQNTPVAAEQFFDDDDTSDAWGRQVNEKLNYLLTQRTWPSDGGDGIGIAIEGATTHSRNPPDMSSVTYDPATGLITPSTPDSRAATWAAQTVYLLAGASRDEDWDFPPAMADSMGRMLASYAGSVVSISKQGPVAGSENGWVVWDSAPGHQSALQFKANYDDLAGLIRDLGAAPDQTGTDYLIAGLLVHQKQEQDKIIAKYSQRYGYPNNLSDLNTWEFQQDMVALGTGVGKALAFSINNAYKGLEDGETKVAEQNARYARGFEIAAGIIPVGGIPGVSAVTDIAIKDASNRIADSPQTASDRAQASEVDWKMRLDRQMYDSLLNAGVVPIGGHGVPEEAVITVNGERRIDPRFYDQNSDVDPRARDKFNLWRGRTDENLGVPDWMTAPIKQAYNDVEVPGI